MIKLNINNIIETALAIGLVAAVGFGIFYFAQRKLGFFSYPEMTRDEVIRTYKEVETRLPILSRACKDVGEGKISCRGIYLNSSSGMLYYHFEDDPANNKASYDLYSVPWERWSTDSSLIDRGKITQIGQPLAPDNKG